MVIKPIPLILDLSSLLVEEILFELSDRGQNLLNLTMQAKWHTYPIEPRKPLKSSINICQVHSSLQIMDIFANECHVDIIWVLMWLIICNIYQCLLTREQIISVNEGNCQEQMNWIFLSIFLVNTWVSELTWNTIL